MRFRNWHAGQGDDPLACQTVKKSGSWPFASMRFVVVARCELMQLTSAEQSIMISRPCNHPRGGQDPDGLFLSEQGAI
jgi:hypothetical protein